MQNQILLTQIVGERAAQILCLKYTTLTALAKADVVEMENIPGVGRIKTQKVKAALELASLLSREIIGDQPILDTPSQVADYLRDEVRPYTTETLKVILLNSRKRLIRVHDIATGTLDTVLADPRAIFRQAIMANAASVILVHNHPSSDPTPSEADIKVTRDMIRAGQLLRIEVVDHVILGNKTESRPKDYSSLRELGYFYDAP